MASKYICPGCQRPELHLMCPAYGTPFYMSGTPPSGDITEPITYYGEEKIWNPKLVQGDSFVPQDNDY